MAPIRSAPLHRLALAALLVMAAQLMAACGSAPPPVGSCTLPLPADAGDEDAIKAVIHAEGQFVVDQDIEALMALWRPGSFVADAKNTPDDADNQYWRDKDAIRHRYVRTVFPGAAASANPAALLVTIAAATTTGTALETATVQATTQIGAEISPAGDRWVLIKEAGCWSIESLTYNLEARP
jgi:hypothetical protein